MISTTDEAYVYTLAGLQKENAGTIDTDDFVLAFDKAALNWVRQRWMQAEVNQKRLDDLRMLIPPPVVIPNTGTNTPGGELFSLPFTQSVPPGTSHGYLFMLNCGVKLINVSTGQPIDCKLPGGYNVARPLRRDAKYDNLRDPFWKPSSEESYWYLNGNTLHVETGAGLYASEVKIEYVRYPVGIRWDAPAVNPDLQPQAIQEICDLVIRERLEVIESRRYQTNALEQSQIPK